MTVKWEEYLTKIGKGQGDQKVFIEKTKESIPIQFKHWDKNGFDKEEVSSVINTNTQEIGRYTVVKKAKLWEVTSAGESEKILLWLNKSGKKLSETV